MREAEREREESELMSLILVHLLSIVMHLYCIFVVFLAKCIFMLHTVLYNVLIFSGTHKSTGFRSLKWTVPGTQTLYSICQCKHTKNPPYCDGTHNYLPSDVQDRQSKCKRSNDGHTADCKLCTSCGWKPDF